MSEIRTYYPASVPSILRIEGRSDGYVRLRVQVVGQRDEAVVDLDPALVRDLIHTLSHWPTDDDTKEE